MQVLDGYEYQGILIVRGLSSSRQSYHEVDQIKAYTCVTKDQSKSRPTSAMGLKNQCQTLSTLNNRAERSICKNIQPEAVNICHKDGARELQLHFLQKVLLQNSKINGVFIHHTFRIFLSEYAIKLGISYFLRHTAL